MSPAQRQGNFLDVLSLFLIVPVLAWIVVTFAEEMIPVSSKHETRREHCKAANGLYLNDEDICLARQCTVPEGTRP